MVLVARTWVLVARWCAMRFFDRGRLIIGWLPRSEWRVGVFEGEVARWLDVGPLYVGWRHQEVRPPCAW